MKKILFAAVALMFSVSLFAQAPQHRGGERGPRPEFKPEDLQVEALFGSHRHSFRKLFALLRALYK